MNLEGVTLGDIRQPRNDKYGVIPLTWESKCSDSEKQRYNGGFQERGAGRERSWGVVVHRVHEMKRAGGLRCTASTANSTVPCAYTLLRG